MLCLAAYLANCRISPPAGDNVPNRLLPFSILGYRTLTLDPFREQVIGDPAHYYVQYRRSSVVSLYPVGAAFVALPVYLPCYIWLRARGHDSPSWLFEASKRAEKLAAASLAAASVALLFVMLRQRVSAGAAAAIALVFGLGSGMWAIASQLLWQHGPGVLCILLGMFFLALPRRGPAAEQAPGATGTAAAKDAMAGFCLGMAFAVRPHNALFLAAGAAFLWLRGDALGLRRSALLCFVLGSLPPIVGTLAYNLYYYGMPLGGYNQFTSYFKPKVAAAGLAGLLLSPNRGLLAFSPAALLGLWGLALAFRRWRSEPLLASFGAAAVLYALLHACTTTWAGGGSFGPRYLTETLPILGLAAGLVVPALNFWGLAGALLLAGWSVLVEIDGAVCYPASSWHARMMGYPEANWDSRHLMLVEDFQTWLARRGQRSPPPPPRPPESAFRVAWQRVVWRRMSWFDMHWTPAGVIEDLEPKERVLALVTVRNAGDRIWPDAAAADPARSGTYAVRLAYRWWSAAGAAPYGARSDLREPLAPRRSATIWIPVIAPERPGDYRLQLDLVYDGIAWFADKGADRLFLPARVRAP